MGGVVLDRQADVFFCRVGFRVVVGTLMQQGDIDRCLTFVVGCDTVFAKGKGMVAVARSEHTYFHVDIVAAAPAAFELYRCQRT